MDPRSFDALTRNLLTLSSRRGLLGLLTAVPILGGLTMLFGASDEGEAKGRHKRRKRRNHRRSGSHKGHSRKRRKSRCGKLGQVPRPGKACCQGLILDAAGLCTDQCVPEPTATTCAGRCGTVTNNCGKAVACGPCTCAQGCPACQTCDAATGLCVAVANGTTCDDGDACNQTAACQNGVCVGTNPVTCPAGQRCVGGSCVCDATSCPNGCCDLAGSCHVNDNAACGSGGVACAPCPTCQICSGDACVADPAQAGNCCGVANAGTRCQGGACVAATATLAECGGQCDIPGLAPASVPICGQPSACPFCGTCRDFCDGSGSCPDLATGKVYCMTTASPLKLCQLDGDCRAGELCCGGVCHAKCLD